MGSKRVKSLARKKNYRNMEQRLYRRLVHGQLKPQQITVQESDLMVYSADDVPAEAIKELVIEQRGYLEGYIQRFPEFLRSLVPWAEDRLAPPIVQSMIQAGKKAGVGPMAAVAGAVAEQVGQKLLQQTSEIIIENGGDVFIKAKHSLNIAVFAGHSPLSMRFGLHIDSMERPVAVCTSSGSVGHSYSRGAADAVSIIGTSCPLADAVATAVGNRVSTRSDIQSAIEWARDIEGVEGVLVIIGDKMGTWGKVRLIPLQQRTTAPVS